MSSFFNLTVALFLDKDKKILEMMQVLTNVVDTNNWVEKYGYVKVRQAFQAALAVGQIAEDNKEREMDER